MVFLASSPAFALRPHDPNSPPPPKPTTYCLEIYKGRDGGQSATCDARENNEIEKKKILSNGCAKGQIAFVNVEQDLVEGCLPTGAVQL
jgi:hypothetical protein